MKKKSFNKNKPKKKKNEQRLLQAEETANLADVRGLELQVCGNGGSAWSGEAGK